MATPDPDETTTETPARRERVFNLDSGRRLRIGGGAISVDKPEPDPEPEETEETTTEDADDA